MSSNSPQVIPRYTTSSNSPSNTWVKLTLTKAIKPNMPKVSPWTIMQYNIGIKDGVSCTNICQVSRKLLETKVERSGFQQPRRYMANISSSSQVNVSFSQFFTQCHLLFHFYNIRICITLVYKSLMDTCNCKHVLASVLKEFCPKSCICKGPQVVISSTRIILLMHGLVLIKAC